MDNITFYLFVELDDLETLREDILDFCKQRDIKGKILIATEGITGYLTGEDNQIKEFKEYMNTKDEFKDLWFKHNPTTRHNSKRMLVKIRKEIITFKHTCDIKNTGAYMTPKELDTLYESGEDFVIVDTRNDYEYDVGHFKNAVKMNTKEFSEFPKEIEKIRENAKGKKIITYCTGGVRCEKATAYMKEQGFEDVYQLEGGIVHYGIEQGQSNWEGKCFVFDDRGAIYIDPKDQEKDKETRCNTCYVPTQDLHTCPCCDKEFHQCTNCTPLLEKCCSKFCRNEMRKRSGLHPKEKLEA